MEELTVYLCISPAETSSASQAGFPLCHMAYRIGKEFRLYRSGIGINVRNGLMLLSDYGLDSSELYSSMLIRDIKRECDLRGYTGVVCDFENGENEMLKNFLYEADGYFSQCGIQLYVHESYENIAPKSKVLISTDVTGGSFLNHLNRAVDQYTPDRIALFYDPVCIDFVMPSPSGDKDRIPRSSIAELLRKYNAISYYSHELCSYYFTYRDDNRQSHFVMYDDERSMLKKLGAARQARFKEAFVLYSDAKNCIDQLHEISKG
ncbi:MAG: hypothetical protein GX193_04780 [Clostridiales bacterium]|nr:hypothetical protein [Clostridiales bacterium]